MRSAAVRPCQSVSRLAAILTTSAGCQPLRHNPEIARVTTSTSTRSASSRSARKAAAESKAA
ncbi:hypothetical protein [Nonomuraea recticatena]|uniref:hypothetical protein n=1 Tax=Nonomuraea recticatena TaxID=46178 RepID=UPI00360EB318